MSVVCQSVSDEKKLLLLGCILLTDDGNVLLFNSISRMKRFYHPIPSNGQIKCVTPQDLQTHFHKHMQIPERK